MNARGIPTAPYQVLHLLPEVGYAPSRYPWPGPRGRYPRWGTPHQGTPPIGVCPWPGLTGGIPEVGYPPSQVWRGYPRWGTPPLGYLQSGYPPARSVRPGRGVPWQGDLRWGTPHLDLTGVPPPPPHRCEQTENITFPHPSDAVGKNGQNRSVYIFTENFNEKWSLNLLNTFTTKWKTFNSGHNTMNMLCTHQKVNSLTMDEVQKTINWHNAFQTFWNQSWGHVMVIKMFLKLCFVPILMTSICNVKLTLLCLNVVVSSLLFVNIIHSQTLFVTFEVLIHFSHFDTRLIT